MRRVNEALPSEVDTAADLAAFHERVDDASG
jgi:hypothetical protein